ncbi:hypothetical protein G9A89_017328 [Geosiphon pyriformis]|nr:hypothetical protein G9A89_017328 [Geosiphon pyriformis]
MSDSTKTITEKKNIYSTRTLRYLRVSEKKVIPLLLYLRPEYTDWFNDAMFQEILITLHKHLPEKLALRKKKNISSMAVVDDKEIKGNLCVAEGYQFAYYLRPTDVRHSILFKEKSNEFPSLNKLEAKQKKSGKKRLSIQFEYEDDEEKESSGSEMDKEQYVKYTGFSIFRKTLVIVVEKLGHDFDFIDNVRLPANTIDTYFVIRCKRPAYLGNIFRQEPLFVAPVIADFIIDPS